MRSAAPAFQLCPQRSLGWVCGVAVLWALAVCASVTWCSSALQSTGAKAFVGAVVVVFTLACGYMLWRSLSRQPGSLRWDGQCWHWGPSATIGHEPVSGVASVCLDLGGFMLIHLRANPELGTSGAWLPIERRAHLSQWHLLRCALHSRALPWSPQVASHDPN